MTRHRRIAVTAMLAAMTALSGVPATADAATLMDFLRGGPGRTKNQSVFGSQQQTMFGSDQRGGAAGLADMSDPEPLPKISGPRYYTYKPEPQRAVVIRQTASVAVDADIATGSIAAGQAGDPRAAMASVKVQATKDVADAVEAYYNDNRPLLWVLDGAVTEKAHKALEAMSRAAEVGLDPQDYSVTLPADPVEGADPAARLADLMRFELALSAKALTYVQDTVRGRIDPNKLSGYHDLKRKTVNLAPVLNMMRLSPDVAAYIKSRDPSTSQFVALKSELARLRIEDKNAGPGITIAAGTLLKPGNSNPETANIIAAVRENASDALKVEHALTLANYTGTPEYTPELVALVEGFQKERGLKPDGVVGQATIRAMTSHSNAEKIEKLIVAMEQLRWMPSDLGARYVFINQPAFQAYYVNDYKQEVAMRVVVGSRSNQTYFFNDQIETVEFNPYWGVPQSIIVNEMLPKLRSDPGYLDRLGYEVSYGGRKVSSTAVDWNTTHSVDVRQPPGGDNALGELKILFPNSHAIYMHDTPSKSFFQRDMRALSHGCVRLAEPRVMAAAVMGTNVADIAKQIASGQNRAVQVPQKIPVYVSYFTAWPNDAGQVQFFDDVYGRDDYTRKAFAATTAAREARS
ncbi:L,D-transpeptidase family protein [Agrobacterium sp. a22-2]|uniref:L,D-transpeptidase family protein n=1 Tax=Agrobacterium sp. a22-2 TaxID=2283840 RepID=UPI001444EC6D|nr:L,D-transpeptidase family protein [Agrobacterium sp. a22-2]NKN36599.1 L,D-transpeptidase family protein [Agrobacterium sp. a22-2]